jgi:hypothetical protein
VDRPAASLGENGKDILERLLELWNQQFALEMLLSIPSDLAGNEHDLAGWDAYSVGVTDRRPPAGWMQILQ